MPCPAHGEIDMSNQKCQCFKKMQEKLLKKEEVDDCSSSCFSKIKPHRCSIRVKPTPSCESHYYQRMNEMNNNINQIKETILISSSDSESEEEYVIMQNHPCTSKHPICSDSCDSHVPHEHENSSLHWLMHDTCDKEWGKNACLFMC